MATAKTSMSVPTPKSLAMEGNLASNWRQFYRDWTNFEIATGLEKSDNRIRTATLLSCIGRAAMNIYDGFNFEGQEETLENIMEKFKLFCVGKTNECYERYIFNSRQQSQDEHFDMYITELRKLIKSCNYGTIEDSLLRDKIIIGIKCDETRKHLLQTQDLKLQNAIDICRTNETAKSQLESMTLREHHIQKVYQNNHNASSRQSYQRPQYSNHQPQSYHQKPQFYHQKPQFAHQEYQPSSQWIHSCKFCGRSHERIKEKCPAWNKTCKNCQKMNHFSSKCSRIHTVQEEQNTSFSDDEDKQYVMKIGTKTISASMLVNHKKAKFQLDTGADVNTIERKYVFSQQIKPTSKTLIMWNKEKLSPIGEAVIKTKNPKTGKTLNVTYSVVKDGFNNLLGLDTLKEFNLITVEHENFIANITKQNKSTDKHMDIGDLGTAVLHLDENVKPRTLPCRKVPLALKSKIKDELDRLTERGIIEPITKPTAWVNQMAVVEKKNGNIRICLDPQQLNKALKRQHYKMPTLDDILPNLNDAKIFSKFDVKEAFYHVKLDDESSELTTMITQFGRYRWRRLPFGLSVSSEIFQQRLNESLEGLPGCTNVADDILIFGSSVIEHDNNVKALKQKCEEKQIKLNDEKACIKQSEITFLGHIISETGVRPDPQKVKAITDMPAPNDVQAIRRFCGLVQYLARYIPNLSSSAEPLRSLTRKDTPFNWSDTCQNAFNEIKDKVTTATYLAYFDQKEQLYLQVDSSGDGLGAALIQHGQPIEFASRALTESQKKWAQIEKETLAIVFALERFHQYTYGRPIIIQNDHKPLENILSKPLGEAPKRLQNLMMRINKYNIKFEFVPGSQLKIADTLSRAFLNDSAEIEEHFINAIEIRDATLDKIKAETQKDKSLQMLIKYTQNGWPKRSDLHSELKPYHQIKDFIDFSDGLLMKGERVIIPISLRSEIKLRLHSSHFGYDSMMRRARSTVYWPNINSDLKQLVDSCDACQKYKPLNTKEPLTLHDEGTQAWQKVGIDFFEFEQRNYIVYVDYFSNFIEVEKLTNITTLNTITTLKKQFARYGIPQTLISDSAAQFQSKEFKAFCKQWNIDHKMSSPGHHQSNGKAESAVKTIKRMMKKCFHSKTDPYEAILEIRNTPRDSMPSPAQLVFGRPTRSFIPTATQTQPTDPNIITNRNRRRNAIKKHYDRTAKPLSELYPEQHIYFKPLNSNIAQKGIIKSKNNKSYVIEGENTANTYRRNRRYIHPRNHDISSTSNAHSPNDSTHANNTHQQDQRTEYELSLNIENNEHTAQQRHRRIRNKPRWLDDHVQY